MTERDQFNRDLVRTVLLGRFVAAWGVPDQRIESTKGESWVEVYSFPPRAGEMIHRIASVGASELSAHGRARLDREFVFVLPGDLAGATFEEVAHFLMDVVAFLTSPGIPQIGVGQALASSTRAPGPWRARSILLDELRGEPVELSAIHVGAHHVEVMWLVPIYENERNLIESKGVRALDALVELGQVALVDPRRDSAVGGPVPE